ncbi:phage gp6-like head-tail connector protein [Martelella lutilitoris]|uniref:Phage gp6-like head-tail connector protein n=1 Tax=Martelella lutilitoris TaxID=2583532 RepID=A0A5C4JWF6_9HYPH|nr:head-tail connector protein [Martelella lutilitoris]TNB48989.1 phage gp6-like head-tail connector protein [Martelella lutilitoris]
MVTLAAAKTHLSVDFDDDEAAIERFIAAASAHLASIGVDMNADPLPEPLSMAVLMLVGHFYMNREATADAHLIETPLAVDRLIAPYRESFA